MSHTDGPYDPDAPERGDALKLALIGLVFAGIAMAVGPDTPAGRWLVISSSLLFAAAGVAMVVTSLMEGQPMGRRQPLALPVGLLTAGFFGIGGVLLLVRQLRRR